MRVRLNKQPTNKQKGIIREECKKEFTKCLEKYNHDTAIQVLHILRFDFNFGQKRLQRFADKLAEMQADQLERYELSDADTPWICEKQLENSGINIDKILIG